jgi:hypothetical protein
LQSRKNHQVLHPGCRREVKDKRKFDMRLLDGRWGGAVETKTEPERRDVVKGVSVDEDDAVA